MKRVVITVLGIALHVVAELVDRRRERWSQARDRQEREIERRESRRREMP